HIGLVSAIPFLLGAAAMIFGGWRSDKSGQRYPYTILGPLLGAVGFTASGLSTGQPLFSLIALTLGIACFNAVIGPFWPIATAFLRGRAAAVGFAIITEAGSIGGFLGSRLLGDLRQLSGDFHSGLLLIAACLAAAGLLMAVLAWGGQRRSLGAPARAQA